MATIRKTYSTEFKVKVVREILREEKSLSQIASGYGTHTPVLRCAHVDKTIYERVYSLNKG